MKKTKIVIFILAGLALALSAIPVIIFIINFKSTDISKDISDWAAFGDYIGGTINTIITFSSLIILSYLTYLVSAQSSIENKNVSLLLRRLDAYDKLTDFLPDINSSMTNITMSVERLVKLKSLSINNDFIKEERNDLKRRIKMFSDFYYFLFSYNVRFGHLFKYDFRKTEYVEIAKNAESLKNFYESIGEMIDFPETQMHDYDVILARKLFRDVSLLTNYLREELK